MTRKIDARKNNAVTDRSTLEPEWQRRFHEQKEQQLGLLRGATTAARSRQ